MKTALFCLVVIAVSYTCSAYDFSDTEFNELIEEEVFEDAITQKYRIRRDIDEDEERSASGSFDDVEDSPQELQDVSEDRPGHGSHCKKHQKGCCGKTPLPVSFLPHHHHHHNHNNNNNSNNQTMRSAGSECYEEVNLKLGNKTYEDDLNPYNCEKVKRMKKRFVCIHECKAKKQEVANEAGSLDFAKVKAMLSSRVNETWQKELIEKAVDDCSKITYDETWKEDSDEYKCNPQALQFKHCVWKKVELQCPAEHQNTGRHCQKLRAKLNADKSRGEPSSG